MDSLSTINTALRFSRGAGRFTGRNNRGGASPFGCCGIFLVLISTSLLFWNEGRAVRRYSILYEGQKAVVEVENLNVVDPANEGKLVHLVGTLKNSRKLHDEDFGVTSDDALKLARSVRMFQWGETAVNNKVKNPDGSTSNEVTYQYTKAWFPHVINSNSFHHPDGHVNPDHMMFPSYLDTSDTVSIGAYKASKPMVDSMNWFNYKTDGISIDNIVDPATKAKAQPTDGGFYFGNNPDVPKLGDNKVLFLQVLPSTVTIMAQQKDNSFVPYHRKHKGELMFLERGNHTADEIFESELAANKFLTWLFRVLGVMIMYAGVSGMLSPLAMLLHAVPFVGQCIGDTLLPLLTSLVAGAFSGVVVAVAWLRFHPLAGISFILVVGGLTYMAVKKTKQMNAQQQQGDGGSDETNPEETNPMTEPLLEEGEEDEDRDEEAAAGGNETA